MAKHRLLQPADVPLELVILAVAALAVGAAGVLLFPISAGALPYNDDGIHGVLLVIFALQTITMGKTPFGDARRSLPVVALGVLLAGAGILTCFVPDVLGEVSRLLLIACFGAGGLALLLRNVFDQGRYRTWLDAGGVLRQLVWATATVYLGSVLVGGLLLWREPSVPLVAAVLLVFAVSIVVLAGVLRAVYRTYPQAARPLAGELGLTTDQAMILLLGITMVLLGLVLVPVSLGVLPFSGSAQLGLMMVLFAVQMLGSGTTPVGPFPRSWLILAVGFTFAALGIVSAIVPDILVLPLTLLIGGLNIVSGAITLAKSGTAMVKKLRERGEPVPAILVRLTFVQLAMGMLALLFGASMLVSQLITGPVLGVILTANGCVLLYELWILFQLDKLQVEAAVAA